jgi:prepilin-type N-terminal cleavage/methylation domain-containing protein
MGSSRSSRQSIQLKMLLRLLPKKGDRRGFTLIELLVAMLISGLLVSGLLYLVVEVLGINQKDSSRNDTQRDMQMAMDYITRDLREAFYVYGASEEPIDPTDPASATQMVPCLSSSPLGQTPDTRGASNLCTGLLKYLPAHLVKNIDTGVDANIPVLAFWKPEPLPEVVTTYCRTNATSIGLTVVNNPVDRIPCVAQRMYTLVVYSLSTENTGGIWKGRARIKRYALPHFPESATTGVKNKGWVAPVASDDKRPLSWPYGKADGGIVDLQQFPASATIPKAESPENRSTDNVVLTDFVDFNRNTPAPISLTSTPAKNSGYCPHNFEVANFGKFRPEFYACVRRASTNENPEVRVVIKGNAAGRGGIPLITGEVPFQMESHVIGRGAYGKQRAGS